MVDSSATTGFPSASAAFTSGEISRYLFMLLPPAILYFSINQKLQ
jgi:hypothetical protein